METTSHGWQIVDRDAGVLYLDYIFADPGKARTIVGKIPGNKLLVISPCVGLNDGIAGDLAEFGEVAAVVAPNGFHHLGIHEWRTRYPNARFFAPTKAAERIAKKSDNAGELEPISALQSMLGNVGLVEAPHTKCGEVWAWFPTATGNVWFASDILCNWDQFPGNFVVGMLWKLTGSGPGFKPFNLAMMAIVKDKKKLLAAMLEDLQANKPSKVIMSHGTPCMHDHAGDDTVALVQANC